MPVSNTAPNVQIWVTGASGGNSLFRINGDPEFAGGMTGYELTQFYQSTTDNPGTVAVAEGLYRPADMVFDTVHGKFFLADSDQAGHNRILQGNIADLVAGNPPALTVLYEDVGAGAGTRIDNLEIDPNSGIVYFTHGDNLEKILYDTANQIPVLLFNANVTAGSSPSGIANPAGATNNFFNDMVINFTTGEIFLSSTRVLTGGGGDNVSKNFIYHLSGLIPGSGTNAFQFAAGNAGTARLLPVTPDDDAYNPNPGTTASPAIGSNEDFFFPVEYGTLDGLAIDPATNTLYFSTGSVLFDHDVNSGTAPILMRGGIFSYALSGNPTGTYTQIYQQNGSTGPQGLLGDLEIDPTTGQWYVTDYTGGTTGAGDEGVWTGNLNGSGTPSLFSLTNNPSGQIPSGFTLNLAPTLTGTETGATATEGAGPGSGFSADVFGLTAIDSDDYENADQTDHLAGAQIRISAGFGSSPGSTEQLTINGTTAGVLGSGIAYSYNSGTGVMTLTGVNSFANYEAALALVAYSIDGDNPDNYGASPTRTLSYSVFDGLLLSDEYDTVVSIAGTNDDPVNTTGGAVAATEDASVAVTGLAVSDVDSPSLSVTLAVGRGTLAIDTGVPGGVGAGQVTGNNTGSVTLTGTQSEINTTLAAANGVLYTPTPDINGPDTLTMTSDDGTDQDVDMVAINVAAVNDAPTVAGDGTEEAAPIVEDMPSPAGQTVSSLFAGQYSDALDQVAGGSSADAFAGIAVTANNSNPAQGQWQYFNGVVWVDIGAASDGAAVLLAASTSIRFNPALDFSGAGPTLVAHLVDSSAGAIVSGALADLSVTGGTTQYSTGTVTLDQAVTVDNDAPTGVTGTLQAPEDAVNGSAVGTLVAQDPDSSGPFTYTMLNNAGGRFAMDNTGNVTVADGLLLDFEQQSSHTIRVRVTDDMGASSEFDVDVSVLDVLGEDVNGDNRDNIFWGGAESDLLKGNNGNDTLKGGGGADTLDGGNHDDILDGGAGMDVMTGGSGGDVFVFHKGEANGDVIMDFKGQGSGGDEIHLFGYAPGTTFTRIGNGSSDLYQINDHGFIEYVTIHGPGHVPAGDVHFMI